MLVHAPHQAVQPIVLGPTHTAMRKEGTQGQEGRVKHVNKGYHKLRDTTVSNACLLPRVHGACSAWARRPCGSRRRVQVEVAGAGAGADAGSRCRFKLRLQVLTQVLIQTGRRRTLMCRVKSSGLSTSSTSGTNTSTSPLPSPAAPNPAPVPWLEELKRAKAWV